jgi:hypothetical protein
MVSLNFNIKVNHSQNSLDNKAARQASALKRWERRPGQLRNPNAPPPPLYIGPHRVSGKGSSVRYSFMRFDECDSGPISCEKLTKRSITARSPLGAENGAGPNQPQRPCWRYLGGWSWSFSSRLSSEEEEGVSSEEEGVSSICFFRSWYSRASVLKASSL